jgi:hypothetical protein
MSDMSVSRTSTPTSLPHTAAPTRSRSLASVGAPSKTESQPEVQRSASQPQLFKGPQTAADPSSEAHTKIESTPSSTVGQNQLLMQTSRDAIMADVSADPFAGMIPAAAPPVTEAQSCANLRKCFEFSEVSLKRSADGTPNITVKDLMLMSHNPLASTQAKKESEVFRFFCKSEFSGENPNFLDKAYQLSKLEPGSVQFDQQLSHIVNQHIGTSSEEQVNIPWGQREKLITAHRDFQTALAATPQDPQVTSAARAKLVEGISASVKEVTGLVGDTFQRFSIQSANNHKFRNVHILSSAGREFRQSSRLEQAKIRDHIKLYNNYQKSLSDPHWQAKETAAKRRHERVTSRIIQASGAQPGTLKFGLYNTFVRPWKSW